MVLYGIPLARTGLKCMILFKTFANTQEFSFVLFAEVYFVFFLLQIPSCLNKLCSHYVCLVNNISKYVIFCWICLHYLKSISFRILKNTFISSWIIMPIFKITPKFISLYETFRQFSYIDPVLSWNIYF